MSYLASITNIPIPLEGLLDWVEAYRWQDLVWSIGVIVVLAGLGIAVATFGLRGLRHWAGRTDTAVDDAIAEHLGRPLRWLLPVIALELGANLLVLPDHATGILRHTLLVLLILLSGWLCIRILKVIAQVVRKRFDVAGVDNLQARTVHTQTRTFYNIGVFVIGVLTLGFALMTFDAVRQVGTGLLASAGLAGVVVGFAAQRTLSTVIAGIQLGLTQPIRVDDVVIVDGHWGRIEEITLTYVVVRIWDLRRLVVPVTYFLEQPFENWTRVSADLLGTVELELDYATPIDPLRAELKRIVEASEHWDRDIAAVQVTAAGPKTITVRPLVSAADSGKLWNLRCEVREKLLAYLQRNYPDCLPRHRGHVEVTRQIAKAG